MLRNRKLFALIIVLSFTSLACGVSFNVPTQVIETGPLVTDEINIPLAHSDKSANFFMEFGAGELSIQSGSGPSFVTGTATYNLEELKPDVSTNGNSVYLDQGDYDFNFSGIPNFEDIENDWDLRFSDQPVNIDIRAGAFEGDFDFGGMALTDLSVVGGASSVKIDFSTPNLVSMDQFHFESGASDVQIRRLANANFSRMNLLVGAGQYTLDFSGDLQQDAEIDITGGLSAITIIVPEGVNAVVHFHSSLSDISVYGDWSGSGSRFRQSGDGPTLTFNIEIGIGQVELRN